MLTAHEKTLRLGFRQNDHANIWILFKGIPEFVEHICCTNGRDCSIIYNCLVLYCRSGRATVGGKQGRSWTVSHSLPSTAGNIIVRLHTYISYLHSRIYIPTAFPIPIHSCSWQLGLESESDSTQCEKFCIIQCSHLVCSPNRNQYPNPEV